MNIENIISVTKTLDAAFALGNITVEKAKERAIDTTTLRVTDRRAFGFDIISLLRENTKSMCAGKLPKQFTVFTVKKGGYERLGRELANNDKIPVKGRANLRELHKALTNLKEAVEKGDSEHAEIQFITAAAAAIVVHGLLPSYSPAGMVRVEESKKEKAKAKPRQKVKV